MPPAGESVLNLETPTATFAWRPDRCLAGARARNVAISTCWPTWRGREMTDQKSRRAGRRRRH